MTAAEVTATVKGIMDIPPEIIQRSIEVIGAQNLMSGGRKTKLLEQIVAHLKSRRTNIRVAGGIDRHLQGLDHAEPVAG
jgi:hypothetical protein